MDELIETKLDKLEMDETLSVCLVSIRENKQKNYNVLFLFLYLVACAMVIICTKD
jgi:hypothetical protein